MEPSRLVLPWDTCNESWGVTEDSEETQFPNWSKLNILFVVLIIIDHWLILEKTNFNDPRRDSEVGSIRALVWPSHTCYASAMSWAHHPCNYYITRQGHSKHHVFHTIGSPGDWWFPSIGRLGSIFEMYNTSESKTHLLVELQCHRFFWRLDIQIITIIHQP